MTSISSEYLSITILAGFTALSLNIIIYQQNKLSQMIDRLSSENHLLLTQIELAKTNTKIEEQHDKIATIRHKINDIEDGISVDYDMDEKDKTELLKELKENESVAVDHLIELQEFQENLQNDKFKCANRIRTFLMQRI